MEQNICMLNDKLNYISNVRETDKERFKRIITWAGEMIDLTIKERIVKGIFPKKGEIWTCNLGQNVGAEINKVRPVYISSNNIGNEKSPTVIIIPISHREEQQPTQYELFPSKDFMYNESSISGTVLTEQIKVISKARLGTKIGEMTKEAQRQIELRIRIALGMTDEETETITKRLQCGILNSKERVFIKTNNEAELKGNKENSWLFVYADGSEFYIPNALHIERNDELMLVADDEEASKEAEKAGIPLICGMEGVPNGVYVDTEENRTIITKMLNLYPEYKKWGEN